MSESRKDGKPKKEKAGKRYLTVRYESLKEDTEKGKGLLDPKNGTQAALIYRAVHKAKNPTFAEILEAIAPALKGKAAKTIEANARWYLNDLKRKGLLKASESKEERVEQ